MRVKSAIWVSAYVRRLSAEGIAVAVVRRGAEEAGAIFVKIDRLDGSADLFGPAPQSEFDEVRPGDRAFIACLRAQPRPNEEVEKYVSRQIEFDPDIWVVEVEDRQGRNFLDRIVG